MLESNWVKWVIAGLVAADLLLFAGLLKDTAKDSNQQAYEAAQVGSYSRDLIPPVPSFQPPHDQSHADQDPTRKDERDLLAQEWVAWASFWMLGVSSVGVIFVAMTLRAALQANDGFRVSAEHQLRAYICLASTDFDWKPLDKDHEVLRYRIVFRNAGQTPARDVQMNLTTDTFDWPLQQNLQPNTALFTSKSSVGPGMPIGSSNALKFSNAVADQIKNGQKAFFVWGGIVYVDVFRQSRFFNFRLYIGGDMPPAITAIPEGQGMMVHSEGNFDN